MKKNNSILEANIEGLKVAVEIVLAVIVSAVQGAIKTVIVFAPASLLCLAVSYAVGSVGDGLWLITVGDSVIAVFWGLWTLFDDRFAMTPEEFIEDLKGSLEILQATAHRCLASVWMTIILAVIAGIVSHNIVLAVLMAMGIHATGCLTITLLARFLTGECDVPFWEI